MSEIAKNLYIYRILQQNTIAFYTQIQPSVMNAELVEQKAPQNKMFYLK